MKKETLSRIQRQALEKLKDLLLQAGLDPEWNDAEEAGLPDSIMVLHTDLGEGKANALGEYYFFPSVEDEPEQQRFIVTLTVADDVTQENAELLKRAISRINYELPFGAFVMDPKEELLSYRYTSICDADTPQEQLLSMMNYNITTALYLTAQWVLPILELQAGMRTYEEFLALYF